MEIKQYLIILVNLDPTIGSEIQNTRPFVIISPDEMNQYLNTIVVAPLTTNLSKYPSRVTVFYKGKKGMIAIDQIRTIDKVRIVKMFEMLNKSGIQKCKSIIKETFVD
jgi:mRNA interferase MazF